MALSDSIKREELFGALLGFKTGDRVKVRMKVSSWRREIAGLPPSYYWKYGTVDAKVEPSYSGEERVSVMWDGNNWSCYMKVKDLVRCRKYVRKKSR